MAEGEFDDFEMEEFGDEYQDYSNKELAEERDELDEERGRLSGLLKEGGYAPDNVQVEYLDVAKRVLTIEKEMDRRQADGMAEYSFIDDDDGKTVTIKGLSGENVEVPSVRYVDREHINFTRISGELYDELEVSKFDEVMGRLKKVKSKNKADIKDQLERVIAITKLVKTKNNVDLNTKNPIAREILDRSLVVELKNGVDTLYFRSIGEKGRLLIPRQILKGKNSLYSTKNKKAVEQYKALIEQLKSSSTSAETTPTVETQNEVEENMPVVETQNETPNVTGLTEIENREHRGVLDPTGTVYGRTGDNGALQIQVDHYNETIDETREILNNTQDENEEFILEERIVGLEHARDQTIEQRQLEEVREQQEEDIGRLQRFKEWLKENWLGASALGITIASFVTTIIVAARSAIVKGGGALGNLGKAIANLAKQAGPLLAGLLNVVATALKWGAAGVAWLANNLWVLVLALVWFAYDQWKRRK